MTRASRPGLLERMFAFTGLLAYFDVGIGLLGFERRAAMQFGADGDLVIQLIFLTTYVLSLSYLMKYSARANYLGKSAYAIGAIVGISLLSFLWSLDPLLTLRRAGALFGTTLFGLFLAHRFGLKGSLSLITSVLVLAALTSIIAVAVIPDLAVMRGMHEGAWRGVFSHKNELGQTMALGAILLLLPSNQNRAGRRCNNLLAILCTFLVIMADSIAGFITLCAMLVAYGAAIVIRARWMSIGLAVCIVCIVCLPLVYIVMIQMDLLLGFFGRDLTFSGRADLWQMVWDNILLRFWLGYGYGAFWTSDAGPSRMVAQMLEWTTASAHNGWLDLWLDTGVAGVAIVAGIFIAMVWSVLRSLRAGDKVTVYGAIAILTFLLTTNLVETALLQQNLFPWIISVIVLTTLRDPDVLPVREKRRLIGPRHATPAGGVKGNYV